MTEKYSNVFSSVGYYVLDSLNDSVKMRSLKNSTNLLDSNFYLSLFELKVEKQTHSVSVRFRNIIDGLKLAKDEKVSPKEKKEYDHFNAWNMVQTQLIEASVSYIENEILLLFQKKVDECANKQVKSLLKKQLNLFVLSLIEKNLTYFLTHEMIMPKIGKQVVVEKAKAVSAIEDQDLINIIKAMRLEDVPAPICNYEGLINGKVSTEPSPIYDNMLLYALQNKQLFGNATKENIGL